MNNVNKTLYIPLYGKAYVSQKNIILHDTKAEEIWQKEGFPLKGKSRSKWLAYYMGMRAAVFDKWLQEQMQEHSDAMVLHIGCGMDSRVERVGTQGHQWYDIDFPEVIEERRKYYGESEEYHMVAADMRTEDWKKQILGGSDAIIVMEGVSMYFNGQELKALLTSLATHFRSVHILVDCYTERAAKASKYKNPINDVGVTLVYGYDAPEELGTAAGLQFITEHEMTPSGMIEELQGMEKRIFQKVFAGKIAKAMYRLYEYGNGNK